MPLFSLVITALLCALALLPAPAPASAPFRPNVVVVMTDDQTFEDMAAMPRTRRLIGDAGATFTRSYVSYPLCCPSRATFLTGQYAHNSGVRSTVPPTGGFEALDAHHTLPVWLQKAGYETSHIGKYLNGYGMRRKPNVPPGWTDWQGSVDKSTYQMYGYTLFENGTPRTYGTYWDEDPALYQTDVLATKAVEVISRSALSKDPLFLSVNFVAPHGESVEPGSMTSPYVRPAARHEGRFAGRRPASPAYDEADVSDKPPYVRALRRLGDAARERIEADFQARRESLLAVDEAVERIVGALTATGQLDTTYLLFTSDNGFFQGEHRIAKGKYLAYDPATHVPLLVRGPGIAPGSLSDELVVNTDLAPTILEATGVEADRTVDGRSLLAFARDPRLRTARPILHEGLIDGDIDRDGWGATDRRRAGRYYAIRTDRYLFVMWRGGPRELYDLAVDPFQLDSLHRDPRYAGVRDHLTAELRRLRSCRGDGCNSAVVNVRPARVRRSRHR